MKALRFAGRLVPGGWLRGAPLSRSRRRSPRRRLVVRHREPMSDRRRPLEVRRTPSETGVCRAGSVEVARLRPQRSLEDGVCDRARRTNVKAFALSGIAPDACANVTMNVHGLLAGTGKRPCSGVSGPTAVVSTRPPERSTETVSPWIASAGWAAVAVTTRFTAVFAFGSQLGSPPYLALEMPCVAAGLPCVPAGAEDDDVLPTRVV